MKWKQRNEVNHKNATVAHWQLTVNWLHESVAGNICMFKLNYIDWWCGVHMHNGIQWMANILKLPITMFSSLGCRRPASRCNNKLIFTIIKANWVDPFALQQTISIEVPPDSNKWEENVTKFILIFWTTIIIIIIILLFWGRKKKGIDKITIIIRCNQSIWKGQIPISNHPIFAIRRSMGKFLF